VRKERREVVQRPVFKRRKFTDDDGAALKAAEKRRTRPIELRRSAMLTRNVFADIRAKPERQRRLA
jgi:hypothetical protein